MLASGRSGSRSQSHSADPLFGSTWKSSLVHFQYEENLLVNHHAQYPHFLVHKLNQRLPANLKVKKMTALQIDLDSVPGVMDVLSHHYVEMETEDGQFFTIEKDKVCILMQSARSDKLRKYRGGEKRKKRGTIRVAKEKENCDFSIQDVVLWIFRERLLEDKYDINLSNCQHFVHHLWRKFACSWNGAFEAAIVLSLSGCE